MPTAHEVDCKVFGDDMQFVGKIKSALFGGKGLFLATLRGPGRV
jgi:uncharacterized protein (AIM24 family)